MKKITAPIVFGQKGDHIANLHQALIQLLFNIDSAEEIENQQFGEATQFGLKRFQRAQYLPGTGMVDSATAAQLNDILNLSDEAVYEVSGYVQDRYRKRIATQRIVAFDVDLRGAAVYESVQSLEEIEEVGGFERIGETETDRNGEYRLWFGQSDFWKMDRGLADVIVYVVVDGVTSAVNTKQIVGSSRIVFKKEYDRKRRIENLIITLDRERHQSLTDYQDMLRVLTPFLRESGVQLNQLHASEKQITFLAEEIDRDVSKVRTIARAAELSKRYKDLDLNQELLYGLGSRKIPLTPFALAGTPIRTLKESLNRAVASNMIAKHNEDKIELFCTQLQKVMTQESLDRKREERGMEPRKFFDLALSGKRDLQERLLSDLVNYEGGAEAFFSNISTHPIFQEHPEQMARLEIVGQLAIFSDFHFPLVEMLMKMEDGTTMSDFIRIDEAKWREILDEVGWPVHLEEEEAKTRYLQSIRENLRAAYPGLHLSMMIEQQILPLSSTEVRPLVSSFLKEESGFDIRTSRVIDFKDRIGEMAGDQAGVVIEELKTVQRLFQLSPTPEVMTILNESGLHSAYHISRIPRQSFLRQYSRQLGDEQAFNVHEKALHIQARSNYTQTMGIEASSGIFPESMWGPKKKEEIQQVIEQYIPNWETLFGRFDICECEHCDSVFSPSAYLVDILRFLKYSTPNLAAPVESPLDHLSKRRPDIPHLPLTCENTHTVLPYIDLVNEVMEYYVVHDKLDPATAHDTDGATTEELQAEPQHTMMAAYEKLADAVYPFSLPYHQPLDVTHSYLDHQNIQMADLLKRFGDEQASSLPVLQVAMRLKMSPRQYEVISGSTIEGLASTIPLWECYGYTAEQVYKLVDGTPTIRPWKDWLIEVPEFLKRSGLSYVELVELIKCRLINPHPEHIKYLESLMAQTNYSSQQFYSMLDQINSGTMSVTDSPELQHGLQSVGIGDIDFTTWLSTNFSDFSETLTLHEPDSSCNLTKTSIRTIRSIYDPAAMPGVTDNRLSLIHRFIRLLRLINLKIEDLDALIRSLGKEEIDIELLSHLAIIQEIHSRLKLKPDDLGVLWGHIDHFKEKSLYAKLFLNRSIQQIDPVFEPDLEGGILVNSGLIRDHLNVIQSALRLSVDDIHLIAMEEEMDLDTEVLALSHLSVFHRYKVLSKGLGLKVKELVSLQQIVQLKAFSNWDSGQGVYIDIDPAITLEFVELVRKIQKSDFDFETLCYLFLPEKDGPIRPERLRVSDLIMNIRLGIKQVDNDLRTDQNIDTELLGDRLTILYEESLASKILHLVRGTIEFSTTIPANLDLSIPIEFSDRLLYQKSSGSLSFKGIMSSTEQTTLTTALNSSLSGAIAELYQAPEIFIEEALYGVVDKNSNEAVQQLLNRPEVPEPPKEHERAAWLYDRFLRVLTTHLKHEAVTQNLATDLSMHESDIKGLLGDQLEPMVATLSQQGLNATYYSDDSFTTIALERLDEKLDFDWAGTSPDATIPGDNFSVRWEGWLMPTQAEPVTFIFTVSDANDLLKVWIDDELILNRQTDQSIELEAILSQPLIPGRSYRIRLDYQSKSQAAGIHLYWRTPTIPKVIIGKNHFFPIKCAEEFEETFLRLHMAGLMIKNFQLSTEEMAHLIQYTQDFDQVDLTAPSFVHWKRLNAHVGLRKKLRLKPVELLDIYKLAHMADVKKDRFFDRLTEITGNDRTMIEAYINSKNASISDFVNELFLSELHLAIETSEKMGIAIGQLIEWTQADTSFTYLADVSQQVKRVVKMKYDPETWSEVAPTLNDPIRNRQQNALITYLLMQESLQEWGVFDADGLFEYFLIDVQMDACMDTSRVKQAISSVQLFIQRCLLNLESDYDEQNKEIGVGPSSIDTNRWEWMKNYRIWEANRKVFLFPENWLEPEWRDDKSPFFKEMESELMQGDITQDNAEKALRGYLNKLETISKMDLVGQYYDPSSSLLHLIGRTSSMPFKYFYRQQNTKYDVWTPWEKIDLDIQGEDDDLAPGVHLILLVWNHKLFLFWPEFTYKERPAETTGSMMEMGNKNQNELEGDRYWEVQLAWSEYKENSWLPKQVFQKTIDIAPYVEPRYIDMRTRKVFTGSDRFELEIAFGHFGQGKDWAFRLSNMFETPKVVKNQNLKFKGEGGTTSFMRKWGSGQLTLENKVYLNGEYTDYSVIPLKIDGKVYEIDDINTNNPYLESFELLPTHQYPDFEKRLHIPVFFQDRSTRYYFRDRSRKDIFRIPENYFGISSITATALNSTMNTSRSFESSSKYTISNRSGKLPFRKSSKSKGNTQLITQESSKLEESFANTVLTTMGNLRFDIFYHPYVSELTGALNNGGITSLFEQQFSLPDDNGSYFKDNYYPTSWVNKAYPKINVDFSREGAYSSYNWELFYHAPLMIVKHLTANNQFNFAEQWCHYLFDPTTNEAPDPQHPEDRYWKFLPFRNSPKEDLTDFFESLKANTPVPAIDEWRDKPFRPHLVARQRIGAYMKKTVMAYLDNLIAWGDKLFRRDSMESINEATQLYVRATHILGRRPEFIPRRGSIKVETYATLAPKLDAFSNAQVEMQNLFPYSSEVYVSTSAESESLLGIGDVLYFCIPSNEDLLKYWDTVADRLFKIRHCMNIDGEVRQLSLFEPPIDPGALVKALASGMSIGNALSDLNSPTPFYRFNYILQKAMGLTQEVKSLGGQLLSAIEKGEAEHLSVMRIGHELSMQMEIEQVLEQRIIAADNELESLEKTWDVTKARFEYYRGLLGVEGESPISRDDNGEIMGVDHIELDVNVALRNLEDEGGIKLINREWEEIDQASTAHLLRMSASIINALASVANVVPNFSIEAEPWGVGGSISFGGGNLGSSLSAHASSFNIIADHHSYKSQSAARIAGYIRREQEWNFSVNQTGLELKQIAKQIKGAEIRKQITELELKNHQELIKRTEEIETYLTTKFTNEELYLWMKDQILSVYKDSYNLAYELAKQAEKTFRFDFGDDSTNFIQYGYWNSAKEGLLAGNSLYLALSRMDKGYQDRNKRQYELTKHLSLSLINPTALLQLKENGTCTFDVPELMYDLDHPGHYFRRIKSVSITIPCIIGPYASVPVKLTLMKNRIRKNGNSQTDYAYTGIEDSKFAHNLVGMQSIATSSAQGDSGMFELNFRDERYLPFEGAGVISTWKLELPNEFRCFNYDTISDVILHMNYTAREGGDALKEKVNDHVKTTLNKWMDELAEEGTGLVRLISMKQEFSTEFHRFFQPQANEDEQSNLHIMAFETRPQHFPYFLRNRDLSMMNLTLAIKLKEVDNNDLIVDLPVALYKVQDGPDSIMGTVNVLAGSKSTANLPAVSFDMEEDLMGRWRIHVNNADVAEELKVVQPGNEPAPLDSNKVQDLYFVMTYTILG